jgi:membrane protease YdiL (CAAX protease family)
VPDEQRAPEERPPATGGEARPRRSWLAWTIGPRPADTFGEQFGEVVRRTAWILPFEWLVIGALIAAGVGVGNAGAAEIDALMERGPLYFLAVGAVLAPAIEEALFRGLPSLFSDWFLRRKDGARWVLGVVCALSFALVHNLAREPGAASVRLVEGYYFDCATVPAPQFAFGLLLWDLVRRYGLWASSFSHMLHNFVLLTLGYVAKSSS